MPNVPAHSHNMCPKICPLNTGTFLMYQLLSMRMATSGAVALNQLGKNGEMRGSGNSLAFLGTRRGRLPSQVKLPQGIEKRANPALMRRNVLFLPRAHQSMLSDKGPLVRSK